jgi:hypothetical protein
MGIAHEVDYARFLVSLGQECPHIECDLLRKTAWNLYNNATEYTRLRTIERIEGELEPELEEQLERLVERSQRIAQALGVSLLVQPDPRGVCFKLLMASGRTNDMDGVGVVVPTGKVNRGGVRDSERQKRERGSRRGPDREERARQRIIDKEYRKRIE